MANEKKRKAVAKSNTDKLFDLLKPHELPEYLMFLSIDLNDKMSILAHVPLVEGMGTAIKIPEHILGHDTSFPEVLWKIRQFRQLNKNGQKLESDRWRLMPQREQSLYLLRKKHVIKQQWQRRAEEDAVEPPSKRARASAASTDTPTTLSTLTTATALQTTTTVSKPSQSMHTANTTSTITPNPVPSTSSGMTTRMQSRASQQQASDANETTHTATAVPPINTTGTQSHRTRSSSTRETRTEPLGDLTNTTSSLGSDKFVGLISSKDEREKVMPTAPARSEKANKVDRTRKIGVPCQNIRQQADSKAMEAVHRAMTAVATACDTTSLPGRPRNAPGHKLVLFILNQVSETPSCGGATKKAAGSLQRKRPVLTVVSTSARDVKDISIAVHATLKHRTPDPNYELQKFLADKDMEEPLVAPKVKASLTNRKASRTQPSKTPRAWQEVQNEQARESSA